MDENGIEITLECNPEDFSIERIHEYKSIGINRIVLGVQTISRDLHSAIGRSSIICDDGLLADYFCFKGIIHCIDMITGIPGQAEEDVTEFFNMCNHGFEHISVYTLGIERGTPLHNRMRIDPTLEDMQRDLFEKTDKILKKRGYIHYEVSNYALPMFESKHNLKYWKFLPYVGFGAGAHSFYKGERFYNPSSISKYLEDDSLPIKDERTNSSKIVEYIFTCMRLREGISMNDFERKLGVRVPKELMNRFRKMEGQDSLEIEESEKDIIIRFSRESFFLMDSLIYEMTEMLL